MTAVDDVVAEYDVLLSTGLSNLVVLQYPLRPSSRPYEAAAVEFFIAGSGTSRRLVMHHHLPHQMSPSLPSAPTASEDDRYSYSLASVPFTPRSAYAVGILSGGSFHLSVVSEVHMMTPQLHRGEGVPDPRVPVPQAHCTQLAEDAVVTRDPVRLRSSVLNEAMSGLVDVAYYPTERAESMAKRRLLLCSVRTPSRLSSIGTVDSAPASSNVIERDRKSVV